MSSLLEIFGITFESDASDVQDGLDSAESSSDDLKKKLVDTDKAADGLGDSFLDMIGSAKGALASLLSLGAATAAVISTASATDEIGKFSQTLGLNIEEVQSWSEAVVRSGGSAQGFQSSIEGMTRGLTDFAVTGGGAAAETFNRLGISAVDSSGKVKSAFQILPELADQFEKMSAAQAAGFGQRLGLDQGTILLLQQGRRAVDDLVDRQRALGVATDEDYQAAANFNDAWADTKQVFRSVSISAGSMLLPVLTSMLKGVQKFAFFLADHKALIAGFFIGLAATIVTVYLPAIGAALASTAALIAPFLAVAAAAIAIGSAIAIVVDDIYNFIKGNDSLTGVILEKYPNIKRLIIEIGNAFGLVIDVVKDVGSVLLDVFTNVASGALTVFLGSIETFIGLINSVLGLLGGLGDSLFQVFTSPQDALNTLIETFKTFVSDIMESLPDISGAFDKVAGFFGFGDDDEQDDKNFEDQQKQINKNIKLANTTFNNADVNPLNGQTSTSLTATTNNRSTSVSVGAVNVQTQSTDAEGMASAAGGALSDELGRAVNNIDDGVRL